VVRAACRRALGTSPDADDAFQAVFVILARKAAKVRRAALLGPWLHTVAVRAAARARLLARRRQAHERTVTTMPEPADPAPEPLDWLPLLDQEIQRLPERLRVPLILCELEGKSRAEAARLLGIKEGTLSSRLARAREVLRKRLSTAGPLVAGAGLSAAFVYCAHAVPPPLLVVTTKAALSGAVSASVAALTQGVLKAMLLTKLKTALIIFLTVVAFSGIFAGLAHYATVDAGSAQDAKSDKEKLQGTWEFVSGEFGGQQAKGAEAEQMKMLKFVFKGDKLTAKTEGEYTIDSSKKPKQIDLKISDGPENERGTWKGIYELKGDELTLCVALPNQDRPAAFATKEGELTLLLKLKRAK
jgi:RNA polymerase sigma factor (sigma-70 family)